MVALHSWLYPNVQPKLNVEPLLLSMAGIQREINIREWRKHEIVKKFRRNLKYKPQRTPEEIAVMTTEGLKLQRDIKKLHIIKAELNLVYQLKR
jgi:hypothetical protein